MNAALPERVDVLIIGAGTAGAAAAALCAERGLRTLCVERGPLTTAGRLRALAGLALFGALLMCLKVDHATMASLVWVMVLAGAALAIAFTLAWRPHWLAPLLGRAPRR